MGSCLQCGKECAASSNMCGNCEAASAAARKFGLVVGLAGLVLLLFGALRWTSLESQLLRGFGRTDGLGLGLLLCGAVGAIYGGWEFLSRNPVPPSRGPVPSAAEAGSVESRLRQLEDLKAKGLIDPTDYEQRKREIISSL